MAHVRASLVVASEFSHSVARGILSSLTRDGTQVPCIGRWILKHWTTREVPGDRELAGNLESVHHISLKWHCAYLLPSRTLWGLLGTDSSSPILCFSSSLKHLITASDAQFLSHFTDRKTSTKWKTVTTWWLWACSPQVTWSLRIDNVNPCDTASLCHHQPIRQLCMSWSHTLWPSSLAWPLKMFCWKHSESLGSGGYEPPVSLHGPAINLSLLQTLMFWFVWLVHWAHELLFGDISTSGKSMFTACTVTQHFWLEIVVFQKSFWEMPHEKEVPCTTSKSVFLFIFTCLFSPFAIPLYTQKPFLYDFIKSKVIRGIVIKIICSAAQWNHCFLPL